ncbi:6-hydroxymethylpterin diphosphokinase MptE-like protein [Treponema vincentii]|uniref:6-hydroxymethylpterin diphosphokinase MptE-like protein n=1 Tax=Treponema vincentii TaxID=69710 RepID=UPI003D93ED13
MLPFRLHSKYNPNKEAEQFAAAIEGTPSIIVITEPGESYLAPALKAQFPYTKRIAIRYSETLFSDSDDLWDAVWRPGNGSLPFFLLSHIPDEKLAGTRFLSWKAADKAFPDEAEAAWNQIRYTINMLTSVMHTRSFFGNKWLKNTVDNFIRLERPALLSFGERDFILAGAGPTLEQLTAAQAASYSILAVSSACRALTARNIPIDLCIATDAGYWALPHFDSLPAGVPAAFPLEAAVPSSILKAHPYVPLSYNSPLETALFTAAHLQPLTARENGTVTGTACELLLRHTNRNIILAGVDLAAAKGFTHARPHASIARLFAAANRLNPLAGTLAVQNFASQSLETYRQWFLQLPPASAQRLFRAGTGGAPLPNIKPVDLTAGAAETAQPAVLSADTAARMCNTQSGSTDNTQPCSTQLGTGNPPAKHKNSAQDAALLSVHPYPAPSRPERTQIVFSLLNTLRTGLPALIAMEPARLTEDAATLEKQICALCSYTAYCNVVKNPTDAKAQANLTEQVSRVLGAFIKRIEA